MYQRRFIAYADFNRHSPEEMLEIDGGKMGKFIWWIQSNLAEFRRASPESFAGGLRDQDAFTEFLFSLSK